MQGQRNAVGSLPDSINFDYGSTSSNIGIDQQICWNSLPDPAESRLSDFRVAPGGTDCSIMRTVGQEARNLSGWNTGEPSSSNMQNQINHDERMAQSGWSSSMNASARLEDQVYGRSSGISRNGVNLNVNSNQIASGTSFMPNSSNVSTLHTHDTNVGQFGQVGGDIMECSNSSKSAGLEHRLIPSSSDSSGPFASTSGSGALMVEEDDGRPGCSLDGRRFSCKRKAIEGHSGQSSSSASFCASEGSLWQAVPPYYDAGSSNSSISPQLETSLGESTPEPVNPRLRLSMGAVAPDSVHAPRVGIGAESSRRNYRVRTNPTSQQNSLPNNSALPRVTVGHSDVSAGRQARRFVPVNPPLDLIPPIQPENATSRGQPVVLRLPGLRRNIQSVRWSGASSSRAGSSSASVIPGERDASLHEDLNSRPVSRNISEHPMFMPSVEVMNNSVANATGWSLGGGSLGASRHISSSSRAGPGSSSQSSSRPNWGSHRHASSQYSRRLSEYVRRSLLSSAGSESGLQSGSTDAHRSALSSSQDAVLSFAGGSQGQNPPSSRSALRMDRHGDGVIGIPYSLRTLAGGTEGRSRLVSEHIHNVLDIMRRGEGLRFEDVMVLDPSVFFGMADIHDQHRDMRLDVDNMSYEELLALEEQIGNVCTGLSEETILARMRQRKYSSAMREDQIEAEPCCICQEEYNDGEDLGTLDCGHDFHTECIKQWLAQKNLCPICKTTGLAT